MTTRKVTARTTPCKKKMDFMFSGFTFEYLKCVDLFSVRLLV